MIKLAMLATVAAGLIMGANVSGSIPQAKKAPLDTRLIVEVDRSLDSLTDQGVENVQRILLNRIRSEVTSNVKLLTSYHVLNNAIGISVNSQYVDQITKLNGVKSVTKDELHWVTSNYSSDVMSTPSSPTDYGGEANISGETMNKPINTNDGEGTLIAILDNEFYFRAKHKEKDESGVEHTVPSVGHEAFSSFEEVGDTEEHKIVRRFKPTAQNKSPNKYSGTHAYKSYVSSSYCGEEGSLYYNSKVPFYYDYGGETHAYAEDPTPDLNVMSLTSYHGSHVASTASGNAEYYKGIAPKAQLVCMKVFTNFESGSFTDGLGLSSHTGAYDMPILNALEDCITLGVDGINMSLGSNLDDFDSESITLKTLSSLQEKGILSSIAAGNAGKTSYASLGGYANWTSEMVETGIISSYANNHSATTVAAAEPTKVFYKQALQINGSYVAFEDQVVNREGFPKEFKEERKFKEELWPEGGPYTYEWQYVPGFGASSDYTEDIKVRGKVAVVNRGSTTFYNKYLEALNHGAKALIIINNDPTTNDFSFRCSFGVDSMEIPVILVLFKNKSVFDGTSGSKGGTLTLVENQLIVNDHAKTSTSFSSDGITYDLEVKPDISTPGELIRGAIPPQTKEEKEDRPYNTYAFLSGTSMAAPNYAGAQSVVLSKLAASTYSKVIPTQADINKYNTFKDTVDMRFLSTADPMLDFEVSPESGVKTYTSPRIQGAGLADIKGAYNTDVYLEGVDLLGNKTGKAKLSLKDNEALSQGKLNINFYTHNESNENRTYNAYLTVMRPAIKNDNGVVTKDYTYRGEIDDVTAWPGHKYWAETTDTTTGESIFEERTAPGGESLNDKDYYKVSRDIEYYATEEAIANAVYDRDHETWSCSECGELHISKDTDVCPHCGASKEDHTENFLSYETAKKYCYTAATDSWGDLPGYDYQSTQDVFIEYKLPIGEVGGEAGKVTCAPGEELQTLSTYTLSEGVQHDILEFYEYGCYIEGYVTLEATQTDVEDLNLVYVGFYAGEDQDFSSAPVYEPFNFEKDELTKVYPSDLVNDVTKTLIGKDAVDFGSTWIAGYVEPGTSFDLDDIKINDNSLSNLAHNSDDFHFLGEDPFSGELYDETSDNLYVGNPYKSNTMIIQQFILRSVDDNWFTITNTETNKMVYKSCMIDAIHSYGYMNRWPLYKSHVNGDMLASYTADKALAVVPLYDSVTGEPFEDGTYEITFNYILASTGELQSHSYQLVIDSSAPKITTVTHDSENEKVRFDIEEANLAYATVGYDIYEVQEDIEHNQYIELTEDELYSVLEKNMNEDLASGRLFISMTDKAFGETGVIVRFKYSYKTEEYNFDNYLMAQHAKLKMNNDIIDHGVNFNPTLVVANSITGKNVEVTDEDILKFTEIVRNGEPVPHIEYIEVVTVKSGCGGNIATTSITLSALSLAAVTLLVIAKKRKKKVGGN